MMIDVHAHLQPRTDPNYRESNRSVISNARKFGIDQIWASVLTSGTNQPTPEEFIASNRDLVGYMKDHPGMVQGYCYVNPRYPEESLAEFERCIEKFGMVGLKLLSSCRCSDPLIYPLAEKAIALRVPILQHSGHCTDPPPTQVLTDPMDIAELARRYPELMLIEGHIGGGGDWEWAIKAIRDCPTAYLDTSGSGIELGMIEMAVEELGAKRLLFATDNQIYNGPGKIYGADISEKDRKIILGDNAEKILARRK